MVNIEAVSMFAYANFSRLYDCKSPFSVTNDATIFSTGEVAFAVDGRGVVSRNVTASSTNVLMRSLSSEVAARVKVTARISSIVVPSKRNRNISSAILYVLPVPALASISVVPFIGDERGLKWFICALPLSHAVSRISGLPYHTPLLPFLMMRLLIHSL